MNLSSEVLRRLAFVRAIHRTAMDLSYRRGPVAIAAILLFHDSVEVFLRVAAEHLNVGKSQLDFLQYWEVLKREQNLELPLKQAMSRLNRIRVDLKHLAIVPDRTELNGIRDSTQDFLIETTRMVFDTSFSEISLVDALAESETKTLIVEAQNKLQEGNLDDAADEVAKAFFTLQAYFYDRDVFVPGHGRVSLGRPLPIDVGIGKSSALREAVEALDSRTESIRIRLAMLEKGVDVERFKRVQLFIPLVMRSSNGNWHITRIGSKPALKATAEDIQDCIDFIIDTAISVEPPVDDAPAGSSNQQTDERSDSAGS